jgi:hypothetical protein
MLKGLGYVLDDDGEAEAGEELKEPARPSQ